MSVVQRFSAQSPLVLTVLLALLLGVAGVFAGADFTAAIAQFLVVWLACRSWQMLAAQCGLYSFGHAVFVGTGAYAAVWTLHWLGDRVSGAWLLAVPAVGALAGGICAGVVGLAAARTRGTTFAMLTFGLGELVHLLAQAVPVWFGGESGIGADRALGQFASHGFGFATPSALSVLLGVWVAIGLAWCARVEGSALGLAMRLVRDQPVRAEALGLDAVQVRRRAVVCAGVAAGVAGALLALLFEVATPESFATQRSLGWMMAVLIGGVASPWGAAVGAAIQVVFAQVLGLHFASWQLWYGLLFVLVMLVRPGGVTHWRKGAA